MKKLLALFLSLVMMFGIATVGANAATYTDAASITNTEAVEVMTAAGVFAGMDGGAFNPTGALTREQGAKILTYMLLGQKAADALPNDVSSFTDVESGRWSAGSIAYCKSINILDGVGDGTFRPDAPLTGAAFAKMCLVALGCDANRENLVGSDWALNVARLVNRFDLVKDVATFSYGTGAQITRQDAAQIAFNTMKAPMQEYTGDLTADQNGNLSAGRVNARNTGYDYRSNGKGAAVAGTVGNAAGDENVMQFIENYFPNLKCRADTNDYGQNVNKWYNGTSRTDYFYTDAKSATTVLKDDVRNVYTNDVGDLTDGQVYTLFDLDKSIANNLPVRENGHYVLTTDYLSVTKGDNSTKSVNDLYKGAKIEAVDIGTYDKSASDGTDITGLTWKRSSTDTDGIPDVLDVTYGYLAEVKKVTSANSNHPRFITLKVYNKVGGTTGVEFETEEFAKDDWVMVYPDDTIAESAKWDSSATGFGLRADSNIIEIKPAEVVTGTLTSISGTKGSNVTALTVGGTKYNVAAEEKRPGNTPVITTTLSAMGIKDGETVRQGDYSLNDSYTLYLSNGYVVGAEGDDAEWTDYVYVYSITETKHNDGLVSNYNEVTYIDQNGVSRKIKMVSADAGKTLAQVEATGAQVKHDGAILGVTTSVNNDDYITIKAGDWMTLTEDSDVSGYYMVDEYAAGTSATLRNDNASGTTVEYYLSHKNPLITATETADADTIFIVKDGATSIKTFVGISKVSDYSIKSSKPKTVFYVLDDDGDIALAYIDMTGATENNSSDNDVYLIKMDRTEYIGGKTRAIYLAIENGEIIEVIGDKSTNLVGSYPNGVLTALKTNSDGYVTGLDKEIKDDNNLNGKYFDEKFIGFDTEFNTGKPIVIDVNGTTLKISDSNNSHTFTIASNCVSYFYNADDEEVHVGTADDVEGTLEIAKDGTGAAVYVEMADDDDFTVKNIWVYAFEIK